MRKVRAFTLVEILAAVAIIAVLISILMPMLGKSKDATKTTDCMNRERQMLTGYMAWSLDNSQRLMIGVPANNPDAFVYPGAGIDAIKKGALIQYVPGPNYYQCPADPTGNLRTYVLPGTLHGEGWKGADQEGTDDFTDILNPMSQIAFFEESDHRGWNVGSWLLRCKQGNEYRWIDYVGLLHENNTADNFGFIDGHVETHVWKDPDTIKANENEKFYMYDQGNEDWDWLRPRYRQLRDKGGVLFIRASS